MLFAAAVLLIIVTSFGGTFVNADDGKTSYLFGRLESFSYSDTAPMHQFLNNMEGNYPDSGRTAFTHNHVEVGAGYGASEISIFQRYDYYMEFSPATAELIYLDKNELAVIENNRYNINLDANHLRANGIKLAYRFSPTGQLRLKTAISYLQATQLIKGRITGEIVTGDNAYTGELRLDYDYTQDVLFDRRTRKPDGKGFAVDIFAAWQIRERWRFDIDLQDVYNRITWRKAPFTEARITSNTISFDENGFLDTSPVLSGFEGYRKHRQRLPLRAVASVLYEFGNGYHAALRWRRAGRLDFPELGMRYDFAPGGYWSASYNFKARALRGGYGWGGFEIGLAMDSADVKRAKMLGLSVGYNYQF